MDSPVSMDSSTLEWPSTMTPSTGIFSPGRTKTRSSLTTCSTGTSISLPSRMTRAVLAASPISFLMASEVRDLALASRSRPIRIRAVIMAAES